MKLLALFCLGVLVLVSEMGCVPAWKHAGGPQVLSPARPAQRYLISDPGSTMNVLESKRVSFSIPHGWHWFIRGEDFIATRDGVFLQQIFVERLHIDQTDQEVAGAFPLAVLSSKQWPIRTAKRLTKRFAAGMAPLDAAEALLGSRKNDTFVTDLQVREVVTQGVARQQAFRAVFDFRLKASVVNPSPLYRSIYCGFVLDDWFYGISYTAAVRYYFDRDADTFEAFLESFRLIDQ